MVILAALLGFFTSTVPEIMKLYQNRQDQHHELELGKLQIEAQKQTQASKLQEIDYISHAQEMGALYNFAKTEIPWVQAMDACVRNFLALSFFAMYALAKYPKVLMLLALIHKFNEVPYIFIAEMADLVWDDSDDQIFSAIFGFFFGRGTMKLMKKN